MTDIFIRVNDKKLTMKRRWELARCFLTLGWAQLTGRHYELRLYDVATDSPKEEHG